MGGGSCNRDLVKIMMINERNAHSVFQAAAQRDQYASQNSDHNNHLLSKGTFPQGVLQQPDPTNPQNRMIYIEMWKGGKFMFNSLINNTSLYLYV